MSARKVATSNPDAWLRLVLDTMSVDELRRELANPEHLSAAELAWMRAELLKRGTR